MKGQAEILRRQIGKQNSASKLRGPATPARVILASSAPSMMSDDDSDGSRMRRTPKRRNAQRQVMDAVVVLVEHDVVLTDLPLFAMLAAAAELDRRPRLPHPARASFLRLPFDAEKCVKYTRFQLHDLPRLKDALGLPDFLESARASSQWGLKFSSEEGLLVVLVRLAWPHRLDPEMSGAFDRSAGELSEMIWTTLRFIQQSWHGLLEWWPEAYTADRVRESALASEAVVKLVAALGEPAAYLGFITWLDGTTWEIGKPGGRDRTQAAFYDGKGCKHAVKSQAAVLPCGLAHGVAGVSQGTLHDSRMLTESGFRERFTAAVAPYRLPGKQPFEYPPHTYYVCYSDVAYRADAAFTKPFERAALTANQALFNDRLKSGRIAVEWYFGQCKSLWKWLAMGPYSLRVGLNPVPAWILTAMVLTNARCCLYGNQISRYFGVTPPSLEGYFRREWMNGAALPPAEP